MSYIVAETTADPAKLERLLAPRQDLVLEKVVEETGSDHRVFAAVEGPFRRYSRTVQVEPVEPEAASDKASSVRQTIEYELDLTYFRWLFALPVRRQLSKLEAAPKAPWWSPPQRLDARAARSLDALCALALVLGYLGTLLTQTMTYAAREFEAGKFAQGVALAFVRGDVVLSIALLVLADRRGRRRVLLLSALVGCAFTATGALVPSLAALTTSQVLSRGFVTAAVVLLGIVAAEEMPRGSRAYAVSLLALSGGLGAGGAVILLPLADLGQPAWRLLFAIAILGLPLARSVGRHLPESRRFSAPHAQAAVAGHGGRLWLLAASGFLLQVFFAPAAQFSNEYLRTERSFSAGRITLFTLATATPGAIGIVVGGRLAERGRRLVGAAGIVGGVGATVLMYLAAGWPLWAWSVTGSVMGALTIPALGVYGPELFPTSLRGKANGVITGTARLGSVAGLLLAGWLASSSMWGSLGPAMALLALGPAVLAVLVIVAYPETAHKELEVLNPEDVVPP